jgi:class 3 adenylate cyclase
VQAGVIFALAHYALTTATATLCPPGSQVGVIEQTLSFLRKVPPDGQDIAARSKVVHRGDFIIATVQVSDSQGTDVAFGHQTALLAQRGSRARAREAERVLATVMFTDLVGSTQRAELLGDDRWRNLLEDHNELVRRQLQIFKGREIKTVGDGFLATFDSPARAIQCGRAIRDGVNRLGLDVRTGIHTGECEVVGPDIAGIAVHIASRVQSAAGAGEILVSSTVRELVAGSGLRFTDHGRHTLKGIEGDWQLFAVAG